MGRKTPARIFFTGCLLASFLIDDDDLLSNNPDNPPNLQSNIEKTVGLPSAPFMDPERITKASSQVGFIKFVLIPLFEAIAKVVPIVTHST